VGQQLTHHRKAGSKGGRRIQVGSEPPSDGISHKRWALCCLAATAVAQVLSVTDYTQEAQCFQHSSPLLS
jgi:hypothetical protein